MQLKKKHWIMIIVGVLIVGAVVYGILGNKPKIEYTTASVTRGTLLQSVSETGTITPAKEIELNFTSSGQLTIIQK
jgi:multidrug efflux pump subunit AcrA (membrane-fusion protein)